MVKKIDSKLQQDTETLILNAAEKEFMTKGFAGARTTTIAESAGVTHAMFHYYFRTKESLFDRILTEKINILRESLLNSVVGKDLTLEEIIYKVIDEHLNFLASNPELPHFLIEVLYSSTERASIILEKIKRYAPALIAELQKKISEAVAAGESRAVEAEMLIIDIVSLNLFPFVIAPIINGLFNNTMEYREQFIEKRKRENFETIMRKIRP